jgi:hypothetical protein
MTLDTERHGGRELFVAAGPPCVSAEKKRGTEASRGQWQEVLVRRAGSVAVGRRGGIMPNWRCGRRRRRRPGD